VYQTWIGCQGGFSPGGIAFARSTDGGRSYRRPRLVPGSLAGNGAWDPAIAVAPDGDVYVAYMLQTNHHAFPVVAVSTNHGKSFSRVTRLVPRQRGNWGDRDFIAVGAHGTVYVTWDYGPSAKLVKEECFINGSCSFTAGDVNAVIQKSTNGGGTFGRIVPVGPHFPRNGGFDAPLVLQRNGRVDVLYLGHDVSPGTYKLHPGHQFFTSSRNGSRWPAHPLELWPGAGAVVLREWWIDGDLGIDQAGDLYATWDTQTSRGDVGWLSASRDHGRIWSRPVRVTPDRTHAPHIMAVAGGTRGTAFIGWLTSAARQGYAAWVRPFSVTKGWLGPAVQVSNQFGNPMVWPGDTIGLAVLPPLRHGQARIAVSWGSGIGTRTHVNSEIYATTVTWPALP
jgi:hypothetical protein